MSKASPQHKRTLTGRTISLAKNTFRPFVKLSNFGAKKNTELVRGKSKHALIEHDEEHEDVNSVQTISLDQFLDASIDEKTRRIYPQERRAYKYALKCIYLPTRSQFKSNHFGDTSEIYKLLETLTEAFPWCTEPLEEDNYESTWNDFYQTSFPPLFTPSREPIVNRTVDITIDELEKRMVALEMDRDPYYSPQNFKNRNDYESWKIEQIETIKNLIQSIKERRQCGFNCNLNINVSEVNFEAIKPLQNSKFAVPNNKLLESSVEMFYKIISSHEYPRSNAQFSSSLKAPLKKREPIQVEFTPSNIQMNFHVLDQSLNVRFYNKYMLRTIFLGSVELKLQDLIDKLSPPKSTWGCRQFNFLYPILDESQEYVGTAQLHVAMQYERFPIVDQTWKKQTKLDPMNYFNLFEILLRRIVSTIKVEEVVDIKESHRNPFNYNQMWIIQEFSLVYGISEVTKRLTALKCLAERIDLLVPYLDFFYQNIEFVQANNELNAVICTKHDAEQLSEILEILAGNVEKLLHKFISVFPQNKPAGALQSIVKVYQFIKIDQEGMSMEDFGSLFTRVIQQAIADDYKDARREREWTPEGLSSLCIFVAKRIQEIQFFYRVFKAIPKYEVMALEEYYNSFARDVERIMRDTNVNFSGGEMLALCSEIVELNIILDEEYIPSEQVNLKRINPERLSSGYPAKYIGELHGTLLRWMHQAVLHDNFLPLTDVLHSSSVVDLFTAANQTLDHMSKSYFVSTDTLTQFAEVLTQVAVEYAKELKSRCTMELEVSNCTASPASAMQPKHRKGVSSIFDVGARLMSRTASSVPEDEAEPPVLPCKISLQFIVKVNDVEAAKQQLENLMDSVEETKDLYESNDTESEEDSSESVDEDSTPLQLAYAQLNAIQDELLVLITCQFQRDIHLSVQDAILGSRKYPVKDMTEQQIISTYAPKVHKKITNLCSTILTPLLEMMSENMYHETFSEVLLKLYRHFVSEMAGLIIPNVYISDEITIKQKPLKPHQIILLGSLIPLLTGYFAGNGNGLDDDSMEKETRLLRTLFRLYKTSTKEIIKLYGKYSEYPSLNRTSVTKDYHLVSLLATRSAKDKEALKFCTEHLAQTEERRLVKQFHLKASEDEILLSSVKCTNRGMLVGMCHLTKHHLIYEAGSYPLVFNRRAKHIKAAFGAESCVSASAAKIDLKNITRITRHNSVMFGRGLHVYFITDNVKGDLKVFFGKSKLRDKLYQDIIAQAKLVGNNVTEGDRESLFSSPIKKRSSATSTEDETSRTETEDNNENTDSERFQSNTETYEESEHQYGEQDSDDEDDNTEHTKSSWSSPGSAKLAVNNVPDNAIESSKDRGDWQEYFNVVFKDIKDTVKTTVECSRMDTKKDKVVEMPGRLFVTERFCCFTTKSNVPETIISMSSITKLQQKKWKLGRKSLVITSRNSGEVKFAISSMRELSSVFSVIDKTRARK